MERVEQFSALIQQWQRAGLGRRQFLRLVAHGATVGALAAVIGSGPRRAEAAASLERSFQSNATRLQVAFSDQPLLIGTIGEPDGLDPQDTSGNAAIGIQYCIYEGLIGLDADLKHVNQLAESWEVSDDATEFTFKLHSGVKFHDGSDFNADAVKASFDRVLNPDSGLRRYGYFEPFIDHVEVVDESTVKIVAKYPFAAMIASLAHPAGAIPSIAAVEQYGEDFAQNPVGTGPYKFSSWARGDRVELEANADYWDADNGAKVAKLVVQTIPDPSALAISIQTNEVQFAGPINAPQVQQLEGSDSVTIQENDNIRVMWVTLNTTKAPFDNKQVRQALNYAVDKQQVLQLAEMGHGWIMDSPIAPAVFGYASIGAYEPDQDKARQLLAEAGHPDGFKTELWINSQDRQRAVALQGQLSQIGVEVEVVQMEDALLGEERDKPAETSGTLMTINGWSPSTVDADWGIRPIYTQDQFTPEGSNRSFYTNPEVEELILQALQATDEDARKGIYAEIQGIIMDDAPHIFLYAPKYFAASSKDVSGVSVTQIGVVYMRTAAYQGA